MTDAQAQRKKYLRAKGLRYTILNRGILRAGLPLGLLFSVLFEIGEPGGFRPSRYVLILLASLVPAVCVGILAGISTWREVNRDP